MYLPTLLIPLFIGFLLCVFLTPIAIQFVKKVGLIDDPKTHKHPAILHTKPTPRGGGLPIFVSLVIASFFFFFPFPPIYQGILIAGLLVVFIGLLDDKYDVSPYIRFGFNILCAVIVVLSGVTIPYITNPLGGILHFSPSLSMIPFASVISLSSIFAVVWIVWVMNMLNWSKGVDGQMPGIAAISAIVIGIASLRFPEIGQSNIIHAQFSFLVAGAALGYLPYNYFGKMLPGYSSTILGFIIGILSILSGVKLATAILVMGVPMTDAAITIIRRVLAKRSPFWHDKGHLHHLLLDIGISKKAIAPLYWFFSFLFGIIALQLSSKGKLFAIILVIILVGGCILFLKLLQRKGKEDD